MQKKKFNISFLFFTALFIFVGYLTYDNLKDYYFNFKNFKNLNYNILFFSIFFLIISKLIGSYCLFLLINLTKKINFYYFCNLTFNAQLLNIIPFLGLVYKGVMLKKNNNISYLNYVSIYYFSIIIDFILIFIIILVYFFLPIKFEFYSLNLFFLFLFITLLFLFFLFLPSKFSFFFKSIKIDNKFYNFLKVKYDEFLKINRLVTQEKIFLRKFIFFHLISHFFYLFSFGSIFIFFNSNLSLIQISFIYFILSILTVIQFVPQNYGIKEFAGAFLIKNKHINFGDGYIIMIFLRLVDLLSIICLFIFFNLGKIIKSKKSRILSE